MWNKRELASQDVAFTHINPQHCDCRIKPEEDQNSPSLHGWRRYQHLMATRGGRVHFFHICLRSQEVSDVYLDFHWGILKHFDVSPLPRYQHWWALMLTLCDIYCPSHIGIREVSQKRGFQTSTKTRFLLIEVANAQTYSKWPMSYLTAGCFNRILLSLTYFLYSTALCHILSCASSTSIEILAWIHELFLCLFFFFLSRHGFFVALDQGGFEFTAPAYQVLGFKACTTTHPARFYIIN